MRLSRKPTDGRGTGKIRVRGLLVLPCLVSKRFPRNGLMILLNLGFLFISDGVATCQAYYDFKADEMQELSNKDLYLLFALIISSMIGSIFIYPALGTAIRKLPGMMPSPSDKSLRR